MITDSGGEKECLNSPTGPQSVLRLYNVLYLFSENHFPILTTLTPFYGPCGRSQNSLANGLIGFTPWSSFFCLSLWILLLLLLSNIAKDHNSLTLSLRR